MCFQISMMLSPILTVIILIQYVNMIEVEVEQGRLMGERLIASLNQKPYYSFKGVPYAEPPVGKLRFLAPRPPLPWDGIRNATEHGPKCTQLTYLKNELVPGSEDCLFINIYTPTLDPDEPLSVLFFIHGGHFQSSSGDVDIFGPDFLMNYDVVVVTINYRLGALGFLCLDTPEVPGNAGLKDQIAALQWVQRNIAKFGGDPEKVTIFGQSAGGVAVSLHLVSPSSKGLFQRAIPMSGVFLIDWTMPVEPKARAFNLGKQLGLETKNVTELFQFLQSVPADKLVTIKPDVFITDNITRTLGITADFTPVVEKDFGMDHFLIEDPEKLLRDGNINNADLMISHVNKEGLYVAGVLETDILEYYPLYKELFVPRKIIKKAVPHEIFQLGEYIRNYYYGNESISFENMDIFVNFFSYYYTVYDVHRYIDMLPKTEEYTRYFYQFSGVTERNVHAKAGLKYGVVGASHGDDLMYLFDAKDYNFTVVKGSTSCKLIETMCTLFSNFAKHGNPTPDCALGTTWREYSDKRNYLDIGEHLSQGRFFYNGSLGFWKRLLKRTGIPF